MFLSDCYILKLFIVIIQLHVVVSKTLAKVVIDCKEVGEKAINASANITADGVEVLGRMVRSRGPNGNSAPVSGQTSSVVLIECILSYFPGKYLLEEWLTGWCPDL